MWIKNAWYVAGWGHEITGDKPMARTLLNEPVVMYRKQDGGIVALEDRCCHRLAPLSIGRIEGDADWDSPEAIALLKAAAGA